MPDLAVIFPRIFKVGRECENPKKRDSLSLERQSRGIHNVD